MTSKEINNILNSPVTKAAKGRFIPIEELEQLKLIVEAWENLTTHFYITVEGDSVYIQEGQETCNIIHSRIREAETIKKALEVKDEKEN